VKRHQRFGALLREGLAVARSQPVASAVTLVIVSVMCVTILLTSGKTIGSEQAVLGTIDSAGSRTILVRASPASGLTTDVLERLKDIEGIEWTAAFGPAVDGVNASIDGGRKVPVRAAWIPDPSRLSIPPKADADGTAWASAQALAELGLYDKVGSVSLDSGAQHLVAGEATVPSYLAFMEPLVLVPQVETVPNDDRVSVLVVLAKTPDLVVTVRDTVVSLLGVEDVQEVSVSTSASLANLRELIQSQLGVYARGLIAAIFGLTALLVGCILYALVLLRRKDFGRRRALGATRRLIVALVLVQTSATATLGALLGTAVGVIILVMSGDPLPTAGFTASVTFMAVLVSTAAALVPAVIASRRDPLTELRVP